MKKALTIGELLVTMAIIGVIAVLVLPGFMKDYHNKLYVTHLKKVYEMLDAAVNQACIDNNVSYFYQTPYVRNDKNPATGKYYSQEFIDKYFKKAVMQDANPFAATYRNIAGTSSGSASTLVSRHGWGKLAGGEAVSFWCWDDKRYCRFRVDINSTDGPNIGGRDFFIMALNVKTNELYEEYKVSLCGGTNTAEDNNKSNSPTYNFEGAGCLGRIIRDNWEMKY